MITRNNPLTILRRVRKLSRRQLAIARIGDPLILRNAFALFTHTSASLLFTLLSPQNG
jgi:hypothetical protein